MPIDPKKEARNLSPHGEAILAMALWGREYAAQRRGSMDWYDSLPEKRKQECRILLNRLSAADREQYDDGIEKAG